MKKISAKQMEIYRFITDFSQESGYPPSVREICSAVGLRSPSTVHSHLKSLSEAGMIVKDEHKTRAINVNGPNSPSSKPAGIPIMGYVAAGQPILAVENIEGYLDYEAADAQDCFALRVRGDSMINAGILDGDYLLVRQQNSASNGDIVVALIDNEEATVKRFFKETGRVRLQPENDSMEPIYAENVSIAGKVIGLFRTM
jgi:repressor LexA